MDLLARDRARFLDQVCAGGVDRPRVAQAELGIERRARGDQVAELVAAHDTSERIGRLDVQVDRDRDRGAQFAELGERHVRRHVERRGATLFEQACGERVGGRHHHRHLPDDLWGQLARVLHLDHEAQQTEVGDQKAADAALRRSADVLGRVGEPARAAQLSEVRAAVVGAGVCADVVAFTRPDEERDLEAGGGAELGHRAELALSQQHRARTLRDAVDGDALGLGAADDLLEYARALDARDLDSERGAVGKARRAHRHRLGCAEPEPFERR